MTAAELPVATVRFNVERAALYFVPEGEQIRAKHKALDLPRDGSAGEADANVAWLRAIEAAANSARAAALDVQVGELVRYVGQTAQVIRDRVGEVVPSRVGGADAAKWVSVRFGDGPVWDLERRNVERVQR